MPTIAGKDIGEILGEIGRPVDAIGPDGFRVTCEHPKDALDCYNNRRAMIYLTGLEQYPEIRHVCDRLAADLEIPSPYVTCEGFAARKGTEVSLHFDHETNFMLQLRGRKQWAVKRNEVLENPLFCYFADKPDRFYRDGLQPYSGININHNLPAVMESFEAGPGTVTFLPRGFWHKTESLDDSFSIGFVIDPPTLLEMAFGYLSRRLHSDPRWRAHPVFPIDREKGELPLLHQHVQSLMTEIARLSRSANAEDVVADYHSHVSGGNMRRYSVGS